MSSEVQRGRAFSLITVHYLASMDWEKGLIQMHDRLASRESLMLPRFLYNQEDRPIFTN